MGIRTGCVGWRRRRWKVGKVHGALVLGVAVRGKVRPALLSPIQCTHFIGWRLWRHVCCNFQHPPTQVNDVTRRDKGVAFCAILLPCSWSGLPLCCRRPPADSKRLTGQERSHLGGAAGGLGGTSRSLHTSRIRHNHRHSARQRSAGGE
jgi:hypothetical protein